MTSLAAFENHVGRELTQSFADDVGIAPKAGGAASSVTGGGGGE